MAEKQPMLSIGMIVKNEEKKLERCLTALQPLRDAIPCELVIDVYKRQVFAPYPVFRRSLWL